VITFDIPLRCAFAAVSFCARSLMSMAYTVASGEYAASESAIGPAPHPRSRNVPTIGGRAADSSNTMVPWSIPLRENTPRSVPTVMSRPAMRKTAKF